jgi:hypothetical protein
MIALQKASRDDGWKHEDGHGINSRTQKGHASGGLRINSVHHELGFKVGAQASGLVLVVIVGLPNAGEAQPSRRWRHVWTRSGNQLQRHMAYHDILDKGDARNGALYARKNKWLARCLGTVAGIERCAAETCGLAGVAVA